MPCTRRIGTFFATTSPSTQPARWRSSCQRGAGHHPRPDRVARRQRHGGDLRLVAHLGEGKASTVVPDAPKRCVPPSASSSMLSGTSATRPEGAPSPPGGQPDHHSLTCGPSACAPPPSPTPPTPAWLIDASTWRCQHDGAVPGAAVAVRRCSSANDAAPGGLFSPRGVDSEPPERVAAALPPSSPRCGNEGCACDRLAARTGSASRRGEHGAGAALPEPGTA